MPTPYKNIVEILTDSFSPAIILTGGDHKGAATTGTKAIAPPSSATSTHESAGPSVHHNKLFYSQLRSNVQQLQQQEPFASLKPGMAVSFLLTNSYEFIVVFFAVLAQRAVANPLNPNYTVDEILFYLQDVQPSAVVVCRGAANVATVGKAAERAQIPMYEVSLHKAVQHVLARTDIPSTRLCPPGLQASPSAAAKTGADPAMVQQVETTITTYRLDMSPTRLPPAITVPPAVALGVDRNHRSIHPTYSPDDIALFLHTSGTTGRPKGVPLTHRNILASIMNIVETYRLQPSDISYLVMPLFHVHGLIGVLLSTMMSGGTVIVPPKFSVTNFWPDFIGLGATWYSAVPTIHQMLLLKTDVTYPGHSGALRFIRSCSSSLAPTTMLQLERRFQAPVIEAYAMTEAAHQMTANFLPPGMRKPGSVGKGRGVNVQVFDASGQPVTGHKAIGEICVNAPNVFSGYHNNPTATAESFYYDTKRVAWFRTGDLGFQDENKFVVLVGRIKEQINRGGEKISPVEIDQLLLQHPTVAEVVVFGVPSKLYGQEVEAAVILKKPGTISDSSAAQPSEADLKAFLSKSIAAFKVPRTIHIVDQIPKTATGKVQRRIVSDFFQKQSTKSAKL
ncbi:hypothetical protein BASA50_002346 [Batrachochytrium salamandrivorans]|uniref:Peroxisomal-coenzyme A synthetase n=1 Tax=Batrachochytrium salamandrivorans TaxID=1357716 RepID=A0ABQ8FMS0_9FUNG|nr:hypothetical protein BASA61_009847 [Batrachochytrium salamandrivorans]KAH6600335.1 hypothetical protein BASA50_002346 [Batrachochytrium salamandrivorans]KAH9268824.1 hypothetical protein BASA83_009111 [Batrachochytrium salamandrivorans]